MELLEHLGSLESQLAPLSKARPLVNRFPILPWDLNSNAISFRISLTSAFESFVDGVDWVFKVSDKSFWSFRVTEDRTAIGETLLFGPFDCVGVHRRRGRRRLHLKIHN